VKASLVALSIALGVAGCGYSIDEIKSQEADFTVTVSAPWDQVGACLARAYADDLQMLYLPEPSKHQAELVATMVATGLLSQAKRNLFVLDIVGTGPTTVSYRQQRAPMAASWAREARERIERCGKAG
jgi:hypothetical protein